MNNNDESNEYLEHNNNDTFFQVDCNDIETKCGFVAILGEPNAGKSTMLNTFVGSKVSIVSRKVQTTRSIVRGIAIKDNSQIVFIDTPGIFAPKHRLEKAMVSAAWGGASDADFILLLADANKGITDDNRAIMNQLKEYYTKTPKILVINKIDTIKREKLLEISAELNATGIFDETFMVSALNGNGMQDLFNYLAEAMPQSVWMFPEDQIADMPLRLLAAEITREKIFKQVHDEIPYGITVETEQWTEREDGSVRIDQVVYVKRESFKHIILGKGGKKIKSIGSQARKELQEICECKVHLFIFVKVREKWAEDSSLYSAWGLDFNA